MRRLLVSAALVLLCQGTATADNFRCTLVISAGRYDRTNVPVCVPLTLPRTIAPTTTATVKGDDGLLPGQLTAPGILTESIKPSAKRHVRRDLHFILPNLKAENFAKLAVSIPAIRNPLADPVSP
jgi:hypothetical protein